MSHVWLAKNEAMNPCSPPYIIHHSIICFHFLFPFLQSLPSRGRLHDPYRSPGSCFIVDFLLHLVLTRGLEPDPDPNLVPTSLDRPLRDSRVDLKQLQASRQAQIQKASSRNQKQVASSQTQPKPCTRLVKTGSLVEEWRRPSRPPSRGLEPDPNLNLAPVQSGHVQLFKA